MFDVFIDDPLDNCHLNVKNWQKLAFFSLIAKNCHFSPAIFWKKETILGNFMEKLSSLWQFFYIQLAIF